MWSSIDEDNMNKDDEEGAEEEESEEEEDKEKDNDHRKEARHARLSHMTQEKWKGCYEIVSFFAAEMTMVMRTPRDIWILVKQTFYFLVLEKRWPERA